MTQPAPLVPPETDLRDLPSLLIDIDRLLNSDFNGTSDDRAWRAGMTLWLRSFRQLPAASLPADDASLAALAGYGREMRAWAKAKPTIMRNWTLCSDGRLYHRVLGEKALQAWIERLSIRRSSQAGNAKRWHRFFDPQMLDLQLERARAALAALSRPDPDPIPPGVPARSRPDPDRNANAIPMASRRQSRLESEAEAEGYYPSRRGIVRPGTVSGESGCTNHGPGYGSVGALPDVDGPAPFGEVDDAA